MNLKLLLFLPLFFCAFFAIGQNGFDDDISEEVLQQTANATFPEAKAAVLYSEQKTYIETNAHEILLITEVKKRIKFYGEDFDHATTKLYVHQSYEGKEDVSRIRGTTYNLVNGKIEKTKLDKSGIFEKEIKKYVKEVSFTLPAVKKGSIIEFEYKTSSPFFWDFDEFIFQYDIPIMNAVVVVNTPANFLFRTTQKGAVAINETHVKEMDHRISQDVNTYTYKVQNVPALKDENYVDNIKNYRSGIIYELAYVKFSDGTDKEFSVTWDDVAKTISEMDDYEEGLVSTVYRSDIDNLINSETDTLAKMKAIFDFVKTNIKWTGDNGKYFENGIRKAYKEEKGNVADINLSLVSMLRYAGITANPLIISTRDNLRPISPGLDQFNYVIAAAENAGQYYFLDATELYSRPNLLPIRDYNGHGMLLDGKEWNFVNVTQPAQSNLVQMLNVSFNPDFSATGKVMSKLSNHYAYFHRKKMTSTSREDFIRNKESKLENISITNYESEYEAEPGTVTESFEYNFKNASENAGDKLFLKPMLFLATNENPFKSEMRSFPINFGYPFKDKIMVNIMVPEGYEVEFLPESVRMELGDNLGRFDYLISNKGNFISLSVAFEINKASVQPEKYEYLKKFYSEMIAKQQENIVLKKI
ncbi:MAG TPA: DUF3857 domain-containing protein [Flavobacteriaceae bacterium]|nr:DUF3857 domain-containing protein [Flavobacteriaceae bacterium]